MTFLYGETVTRLQPHYQGDPYGGAPQPNWADPIRTEIPGCVVYPLGAVGDEQIDVGRPEITQQTLTVLLPPGTELDSGDRVEYRGHDFEVIGATFQFRNPFTGWQPGGQATIRRIQG